MYVWDDSSSSYIKKEPAIIHISRKQIFNQAAEAVGLQGKNEISTQIREDDFITKIEVVGPKNSETSTIYGDFSRTEKEAIESAYNEALKFYVKKRLIVIDGFNYPHAEKMEAQFLTARTYLMFSEESESMLENELDFKIQGYKRISSLIKDTYEQNSEILPTSIFGHEELCNDNEEAHITYNGDTSSARPLDKIAHSLAEINDIANIYGYEPLPGERKDLRDYRAKIAWADYQDEAMYAFS